MNERGANTLTVTNLPISSAVVEIGCLQHLKGLKDGPWKQICDYLLVIPTGNLWYAVLIEMKETLGHGQKEKGKEQLRRSIPVVKYLESLCTIQAEQRDWEVVMRYVVVAEKESPRLSKERTRVADAGSPRSREKYKGISIAFFVEHSLSAEALLAG